ncbi:MAG: MFS transporter [Bacteroidia bacterium]|nr:MAG: MFS transporter [Bacteroidia bacterium]
MYKTMGISIVSFAFWTSLLYFPWAFKPLWSPYIDVVSTKRNWVIWTQFFLALAFIGVGIAMPLSFFYPVTIAIFALIAVSSASHDIAADGFYMYALDQHKQAFFVGIRSTFYRFAMLTALGLLPLVAGLIQKNTGLEPVVFTATSVTLSEYSQFDPSGIQISPAPGEPRIMLFPSDLRVPLYDASAAGPDSALLYVALSAPPKKDETIVVNIMRKGGTKDIDISSGHTGRLEFTSQNWNVPAAVPLKAHHNMTFSGQSEFSITAGNIAFSWTVSLVVLGVLLFLLFLYNRIYLPRPDEHNTREKIGWKVYKEVFVSFFTKPGVIPALSFFLFYRLGEAQLVKVATPFLVDSRSAGGIGLTSAQYGLTYGTFGMISLVLGGILGGVIASKYGLKKLIWPMALALNVPSAVYIYLALIKPMPGDISIYVSVSLEQFGYGFGFIAYTLYMLYYVEQSRFKTAEFAIGTSLMALGMMLPGMVSGVIKEALGYQNFFIYVIICSLPGLISIAFLKIDPMFGIKERDHKMH